MRHHMIDLVFGCKVALHGSFSTFSYMDVIFQTSDHTSRCFAKFSSCFACEGRIAAPAKRRHKNGGLLRWLFHSCATPHRL
jgi:hypothetical protein